MWTIRMNLIWFSTLENAAAIPQTFSILFQVNWWPKTISHVQIQWACELVSENIRCWVEEISSTDTHTPANIATCSVTISQLNLLGMTNCELTHPLHVIFFPLVNCAATWNVINTILNLYNRISPINFIWVNFLRISAFLSTKFIFAWFFFARFYFFLPSICCFYYTGDFFQCSEIQFNVK